MKESRRAMIIEEINKMSDDAFNYVCENLCRYMEEHRQNGESEEEMYERHCKDCGLKTYL